MKKLLRKYGFTLVELIVVVVILAVLAALAFMIVSKWIGASKDTKRVQDLSAINISFNLYMTNHSSYPFPDADNEEGKVITGTVNGKTVLYKGTIGDSVIKNLGNILTKVPLDPIGKRYAYGITASGKEYEIGTVLENEIKLGLTNIAYGANYKAKLEGTYGGMIVFSTGGKQYIANIPSLVFTVSGNVSNSMNMISSNIYYAINSGNNLPYIITTKSDAQKDNMNTVIKSKTKSTTATVQQVEITSLTNLSNTFSGDRLISFGGNLGTIQNEIKRQSGQTTITSAPGTIQNCTCTQSNATSCEQLFDGNTWGTCSVKTCDSGYTVSGNSCEESACGGTPSGSTNNFYDVSSVPYVDNNCPAHMKTFTCDKGEWKDGINPADTATYQYLACSRGTPTNCSATTYNGYTIPDTTHALSGSTTKDVSENNGTFRYTQNFECNNGTFNYTSQTGPEYVSCNTNYHREGGVCTSDTKSVSCNGIAPSGVGYILGASSISITWNGISWPVASSWTYSGTSACQYVCNSGYSWDGNSCLIPDSYTKLLLHFDGTNNSTVFTDSSSVPKGVSAYGNAKISTTQSKFGGTSAYFDGTNSYLNIANSSDFNFGVDAFTIDFWIYPTSNSSRKNVIDAGDYSGWGIIINYTSDSKFYLVVNPTTNFLTNTSAVPLNTWTHVALSRQGSNFYYFINGNLESTISNASYSLNSNNIGLNIGKVNSTSTYFDWFGGYIDEFRISKGIARRTSTFSKPESQYY